MTGRGPRPLQALAWLNVAAHLAGLAALPTVIRPGSPLVALADRMGYLQRPGGAWAWGLGWGAWMLCALALVAFVSASAHRVWGEAPPGRLAVALAAAGAAVDLTCDVTNIAILPMLAAADPPAPLVFRAFERLSQAAGLIVANGLYSVSTLLVTIGLHRRWPRARNAITLGYGVFGFGMLMVVAGFADSSTLAGFASVLTIGLYCAWTLALAQRVEHRGAAS